jgi:hypothetical protein
MKKEDTVKLTMQEITHLLELLRKDKASARKLICARILLHAHKDIQDADRAEAFPIRRSTVQRIRRRLVEEGLGSALSERPALQENAS